MSTPVIYAAFSNALSEQEFLSTLEVEYQGVYKSLVTDFLSGHYHLICNFESVDSLKDNLYRTQGKLAIFLYSGHAEADRLLLRNEVANPKGILQLLSSSAKKEVLKLVFLNGCSTKGQVKMLLDIGVPFVMATSRKVNDAAATRFSTEFFSLLARGFTLKDAFEETNRENKIFQPIGVSMYRGSLSLSPGEDEESAWGLYYEGDQDLVINLLPKNDQTLFNGKEINLKIINSVFDALKRAKCPLVLDEIKKEESGEKTLSKEDKCYAILQVLPQVIGKNLHKIFSPTNDFKYGLDKPTRQRLQQLARIFQVTMEILAYVLIAQLWEVFLRRNAPELPRELVHKIYNFFYLGPEERGKYHFLPLIKGIRQYLETIPNVSLFVRELKYLGKINQPDHPFGAACEYLYQLHLKIQESNDLSDNLQELNSIAESQLSNFFHELGLLHQYHLVSIQDIHVQKYRHHHTPTYRHHIVELMQAYKNPTIDYYLMPDLIDNLGVVLLKNNSREFIRRSGIESKRKRWYKLGKADFLNLTPFVIDKRSFTELADISKIYFFSYFDPLKGVYIYKSPTDSKEQIFEVSVEPPKEEEHLNFGAIRTQFAAFRTQILQEQLQINDEY